MKRNVLAAMGLVMVLAGAGYGAVTLVATGVQETRSVALSSDTIMPLPNELTVMLTVKGEEGADAVKYGELKIEEAVDDKGTDLKPKKDVFHDPAKFQEFSNAFFRNSALEAKRPADPPEIELKLGLAARGATKISRLRGSLSLATAGTIKTVQAAGWKGAGEKKMEVPKEAGMGITLATKAGAGQSLGIELTGDDNALESIEVVDGAGNKISSGMSQWSMGGGPVHRSLELSRPLDETMQVVAKVSQDRKVTKVDFDLKDVKLP